VALRRVPIHRAGYRPHTFLGGDRELVLFSAAVTFTVCFLSAKWQLCMGGALFWFVSLFVFRLMAKADPLLRFIWLRNFMYRRYYPARSQPWRKNHTDQSTPFARRKKGT
jgi:type IV secretory pathway TrbD component